MLETVAVSAATALVVSIAGVFLMEWGTRLKVRRLSHDMDDLFDWKMKDDKRRAATASVEKRNAPNAVDVALVAKHTGVRLEQQTEGPAWWETIRK